LLKFQVIVGFPTMKDLIFKTNIVNKKTNKKTWCEFVPALSQEQAEKKAREAFEILSKKNNFYLNYKPIVATFLIPLFDGKETPANWPEKFKNSIPDQYIPVCRGRGINLNIYKLGRYKECYGCLYRKDCIKESHLAGEQAEL